MNKLKAVKRQTESKAKTSNPLALRPWHKRVPQMPSGASHSQVDLRLWSPLSRNVATVDCRRSFRDRPESSPQAGRFTPSRPIRSREAATGPWTGDHWLVVRRAHAFRCRV